MKGKVRRRGGEAKGRGADGQRKEGRGEEGTNLTSPNLSSPSGSGRGQTAKRFLVPPVFFRHCYLPVAALSVERGDDLRRSDLAQCLVDRRHEVRIAHCETVQLPIVTGNAHTAGFLGDADNGARHRTDGQAYESHVQ